MDRFILIHLARSFFTRQLSFLYLLLNNCSNFPTLEIKSSNKISHLQSFIIGQRFILCRINSFSFQDVQNEEAKSRQKVVAVDIAWEEEIFRGHLYFFPFLSFISTTGRLVAGEKQHGPETSVGIRCHSRILSASFYPFAEE